MAKRRKISKPPTAPESEPQKLQQWWTEESEPTADMEMNQPSEKRKKKRKAPMLEPAVNKPSGEVTKKGESTAREVDAIGGAQSLTVTVAAEPALVHATKSPLVEAILKVLEDCAPFVVCPSQASTWVNKGGGCSAQATNLVTFESRGARDLALKQNGAEIPGSSSRMRIKVLVPIPSEVAAVRSAAEKACDQVRNMTPAARDAVVAATDGLMAGSLYALGCDLAKQTLNEFSQTMASGSVKKPVQLLQSILDRIRHSNLSSYDLRWRGRLHGLPVPSSHASKLREILDKMDWGTIGSCRAASINVEAALALGVATQRWKSTGPFSTPLVFKEGMGISMMDGPRKRHGALYAAAMVLLQEIAPGFHCTTVSFNRNFRGSLHRDEKDAGPQIAIGLGDYQGGALRVHGERGTYDVDTKGRWCKFDGRYPHEVLSFSGGVRYSVVYYSLVPPWAIDVSCTEEGQNGIARKMGITGE